MINVDDVGIINVVSNVNKSQCQAQILILMVTTCVLAFCNFFSSS